MKETRKVKVGNLFIGGDAKVTIQSMTNTDTRDVEKTLKQIRELYNAGCEIVRCAVLDMEAAEALKEITKLSPIPVVADIHFDYRLALKAMENGISALRINPGNIGSRDRVEAVVNEAKKRNIPIRIGVNSGSLEKELLEKYKKPTPEALVESALKHVKIFTDSNLFSTWFAILIKSICVLPQVGQDTNSSPPFLRPKAFKISFPTFISSTGSLVKDTLIVFPIPSAKRVPIPILDFIVPLKGVPDSVTPRWRG